MRSILLVYAFSLYVSYSLICTKPSQAMGDEAKEVDQSYTILLCSLAVLEVCFEMTLTRSTR